MRFLHLLQPQLLFGRADIGVGRLQRLQVEGILDGEALLVLGLELQPVEAGVGAVRLDEEEAPENAAEEAIVEEMVARAANETSIPDEPVRDEDLDEGPEEA